MIYRDLIRSRLVAPVGLLLGLIVFSVPALLIPGCDTEKDSGPIIVPVKAKELGVSGGPAQDIIGTWILDNGAMKRTVLADPSLDEATKAQLAGLADQMKGDCVFDGSTITISVNMPGQPIAPQIGKYKIQNVDGKNLRIIMTGETGIDDRADAVLDGDHLAVTFDRTTLLFTRQGSGGE